MRKYILPTLVALAVGAGIGYMFAPAGDQAASSGGGSPAEREILYYKAPMDKSFRSDKPGKSPMGMDLIPVYADEAAGNDDPNALKISGAVVNNIGVRTERAIRSDLSREISTVGFIAVDEERAAHVHVRTAGWIEKLYRKTVGETVEKDELIFELYSPELVNAQAEFLQALRLKQSSLSTASRERLKALGMVDHQINALAKSGKVKQLIEVRAPQAGVITALPVGEGMYVTPSKTVFSLADLNEVWVQVDVFEGQSDWVKEGQMASMTLPFLPGENWVGAVDYVYPIVDPISRTVKVRLAFSNADGRLKPNMYGEINIGASPLHNIVSIPREALIRTGKVDRVVIALGDGKYRPAEVVAGREAGDRVEIKRGLDAGEVVVTSGQFLLDSEASINSALLRLLDAGSNDMSDMDMPKPAADPQVHKGTGVIQSISDSGMVKIKHEAIESLGWAAMTMGFSATSDVDLSEFDTGDAVNFELRKDENGKLLIIRISKL